MASNITTLFRSEPEEQSSDSEKLHDLYWNRAELKKEFAALRNEKYELQERIKEHQGATARVQQKMNHLESLLLDREWVHNVVTFYQLRRLEAHCHAKLARFAEELKQQREQRVHGRVLDAWKEKRNAQASRIEAQLGELRLHSQLLEDRLQSERHKLMTMNGLLRLFRGRSLAKCIESTAAQIAASEVQERELLAALDGNQNLAPPDHQGLDITAKRSVNFMILSLQQQLFINYSEDQLAAMAREASEKSVGAVNYGSKQDCDEILQRLEARWRKLERVPESADMLKKRAAMIAEMADFRHDDDVVPIEGSVATLLDLDKNGAVTKKDANLLGENYFGVTGVLSR